MRVLYSHYCSLSFVFVIAILFVSVIVFALLVIVVYADKVCCLVLSLVNPLHFLILPMAEVMLVVVRMKV